jgi:transcriptional regulator with XRE-family HTH domain
MKAATPKTFGSTLKQLRLDAGIGLRELAKMIGKSPSYLSEIESNRVSPPSAGMILDIAGALGGYKNELLAAASKMDPQITEYVAHQPEAADFLRKAREYGFDREDWQKLEQLADIALSRKENK